MRLLIAACLLGGMLLSGCGSEQCQAHGENCSQAFKQQEYGRTDSSAVPAAPARKA